MSSGDNTLFLRLAGPMQSWGTSSRFQLRRSDAYPSKSGVLGLLLCAKGVPREESSKELEGLVGLAMGVRVDRAGILDWDYHTAGAKIGMRKAEGGIKHTGNKMDGPIETLLSRRQYLYDASFLVALQGAAEAVAGCERALNDPAWPVFLGRKCCVPAEPVFARLGRFGNLRDALSSVPWQPRISAVDRNDRGATRTLDTFIEHPPGSPPPAAARLVYDVPRVFGYYSHGSRWIVAGRVTVSVGAATQNPRLVYGVRLDPYGPEWDELRQARLEIDNGLCVFCKSGAVDVHHVDYADVRPETLRSLCKLCHDACTMLEYGNGMHRRRIDPADPAQRESILQQINRQLTERRRGRRRELLEAARFAAANFSDEMASPSPTEES